MGVVNTRVVKTTHITGSLETELRTYLAALLGVNAPIITGNHHPSVITQAADARDVPIA